MSSSSASFRPPRTPLLCRGASALATVVFSLTLSSIVYGGEFEAEPASASPFNGAFVEYGVRGGVTRTRLPETRGWSFDAGVRHSFPMYLGDTRLAYRRENIQRPDGSFSMHGAALTLGLHPFYLALLSRGWVSHFLASLHVELGLGLHHGSLSHVDDPLEISRGWGLGWSLGTGFDLPLGDPNRGSAPWLNVVYRYGGNTLAIFDEIPDARRSHALFAGIGWRVNGLAF